MGDHGRHGALLVDLGRRETEFGRRVSGVDRSLTATGGTGSHDKGTGYPPAGKPSSAGHEEYHMRLHVCMHRATCAWALILGLVMLIMAGPTSAQPVDIP